MFTETIATAHELRHRPDDDPAYNESTYYNVISPDGGATGWVRVAVQANAPAAQASLLLFLPDGHTLFAQQREGDVDPERFRVGGLEFEILDPHRAQRLTFDGEASDLARPRELVDPGPALRAAPRRHVTLDLDVRGLGESFGSNGDDPADALEATMALGHYEQFIEVSGTIDVDGLAYAVAGRGLRDHSWGPRDWAAPRSYYWITVALDDGVTLMILQVTRRDGSTTMRAAWSRDGTTVEAHASSVRADRDDDGYDLALACEVTMTDRAFTLTGAAVDPERVVPLRHRRRDEDGIEHRTRLAYSVFTFTTDDGARGAGFVEALDQLPPAAS